MAPVVVLAHVKPAPTETWATGGTPLTVVGLGSQCRPEGQLLLEVGSWPQQRSVPVAPSTAHVDVVPDEIWVTPLSPFTCLGAGWQATVPHIRSPESPVPSSPSSSPPQHHTLPSRSSTQSCEPPGAS